MTDEEVKKILEGGRHLDAVAENPSLEANEKVVLHELISHLNFKGDFREERFYPLASIVRRTGLSLPTVRRKLRSLEAKGYLIRRERQQPGKKEKAPSAYALTSKLFDEYKNELRINTKGRVTVTLGRVTVTLGSGHSDHGAPSVAPSRTPNTIKGSPVSYLNRGRPTWQQKQARKRGPSFQDLPPQPREEPTMRPDNPARPPQEAPETPQTPGAIFRAQLAEAQHMRERGATRAEREEGAQRLKALFASGANREDEINLPEPEKQAGKVDL